MKGNTVGAVVPTAPAFRLADSYRRSGFSPCPEVMRRKGSYSFHIGKIKLPFIAFQVNVNPRILLRRWKYGRIAFRSVCIYSPCFFDLL